ncbi:Golgi membrane protein 1 isoform X2 [Aquila chrysaetos chrysaetos]|uniref:Golgi membrane protein 1 isoform X2 n=1 Tax=Aquila chrysaetos chrysaetos TaxID=223781 RepID=UPI001B7D2E37|nr:Golgi membrane protein 1 isoform X2 [Aquila chrysaetos chrysaetos]
MLLLPGGLPQAGVDARVRRSPDPAAEPGRSSGGGARGAGRGRQPPPGGPLPTRGATPAPRCLKPGAGGGPGLGLPLRPPDFLRAPHVPARPPLPSPAQPSPALPSPPLCPRCRLLPPLSLAAGAGGCGRCGTGRRLPARRGAPPAARRGEVRRGEVSTLLWFFGFGFFLEMVGLGNSCRGMKSPPLLVAALMACIIALGFNYWIASSRSVDLQGRIIELEGKVHRAAVERGAVELKKNEFQGELEKQRQQIDKIQSLHSFQMENANRVHQKEKSLLTEVYRAAFQDYYFQHTEQTQLMMVIGALQVKGFTIRRRLTAQNLQCMNKISPE